MALREPSDTNDVALAFGAISDAQFGSVAEGRLATAICLQAPRTATVAFPLLDLGFDLYLRRAGSLRVHPVQVKARSFLYADGLFQASVGSLHLDPKGYIVLPYVPPPAWQLSSRLWTMPIPEFVKLARPDGGGYVFSAHLDDEADEPERQFLIDVDHLDSQWLAKIPGWIDPIRASGQESVTSAPEVPRPASQAFGKYGELWLASQLMRSGLEHVVIAQDRLRVDCVDMLLHDLRSYAIAGLVVHTSSLSPRGTAQFRIRQETFFIDDRLYLVVIVCSSDGTISDQVFLIPSVDIPRVATSSTNRGEPVYQGSFRVDPLADKMRAYAVPANEVGAVLIDRLFGR